MSDEMEFGPDILTLSDEEGAEHDFEILDELDLEDNHYLALVPLYNDAKENVEDDGELVILKTASDQDDEDYLVAIEDEEEFNKVSEIFMERLDEYYDFREE